jgi:hypothetical protein
VVHWIATGISRDYDNIARLQSFSGYALPTKLSGATPFDRPPLHHALLVWRLYVYEGMWVAILKLNEFSFNFDRSVFMVGRSK